jgi:quinol monooxygenase YgiN
MGAPARAEQGSLVYRIQQKLDDPRVFLLYEVYRSREDYETHLYSEHFARNATKVGIPLLESRERSFYESIVD